MQPPEQARRWQQRIDAAFPKGVIVASADPSRHVTFPVPRPVVTGMRGLDPYVFVNCPAHDRNFGGVITGWETQRTSPCLVVKVTFDMGGDHNPADEEQLWSGNISPSQELALSADRQASLAADPSDIYEGYEPE